MKKLVNKNPRELSFTIFETIVAVGLLMAFALEMAGGQGNIVNKVEYARRSNDAIWLAKRIMSQVEYNYQTMELKELETTTSVKDRKFERIENESEFDYTYSVEIKEWKFPLFDFLLGGGKKDEEDENDPTQPDKDPAAGATPGLESILNQIFNGHIMKVAHVQVSWPDGARREHVSLTYLLTNNRALDEYLLTKKSVIDGILRKSDPTKPQGAKGPVCTPEDGEGGVNIGAAEGGGCLKANGDRRRSDGGIIHADGSYTPPPQAETPQPNTLQPNTPGGQGLGQPPS